jgi:hypothetical protein
MINKLAGILILSILSFQAIGQDTEPAVQVKPKSSRPNIPGSFALEFGFNLDVAPPSTWRLQFFGCRTFNIYYQYDFRIMNSKFFVTPGIGLSLERFQFSNDAIVFYPEDNRDSVLMASPETVGLSNIKKSLLVTNYIEVPLEIKWMANPEDPSRSFKTSIGGRIGYMYDSFTKVKYRGEGETNLLKAKSNYNLNRFRYGVTGKIGFGNFSVFGYYNLSTLFENNKGLYEPGAEPRSPVNFNTWTIGLSLSSF